MNSLILKSNRPRIHPMVATTLGAITLVSLVGVAAMTGLLPKAGSSTAPPAVAPPVISAAAAPSAALAPLPVAVAAAAVPDPAAPIAGIAPVAPVAPAPPAAVAAVTCKFCGVVSSVSPYTAKGQGTGLGAVGGAVAGGLLGQAFGGGNGRIATTALGAVGGGLLGHGIEKQIKSTTRYRVKVRLNNGTSRSFTYGSSPAFATGMKIRVVNGVLQMG